MASNSTHILIADHAVENASLLERVVRRMMGYRAAVVYSGAEVVRLLESNTFDLVLLNMKLPDMNGLTALVHIREQYDKQQLPVILLGACATNGDITAGLLNGANDFIDEPLTISILRVRMENQLELKQLHDQRLHVMNALRAANATKTHLMRMASHDLKNPLHGISLALALLEPLIQDQGEANELLQAATNYTERMQTLITEFLEMEILHDGHMQPVYEPVAVDELLREIARECSYAANKKRIQIVVSGGVPYIQADRTRLKQAVTNLVSNAVKYGSPHSAVQVTAAIENEALVIHVIDEGAGIPADEVHRLFQPFSRLSTCPTAGEDSTGLGLWIVKEMIEIQNGTVGLNTTYTDGADFWIRLPLTHLPTTVLEPNL